MKKSSAAVVAVLALAAGVVVGWGILGRGTGEAQAQPAAKPVFGKVTVMDTEGHNLIAVDNSTNTLYYYTIDKDAELGSDLKLRASLDLNDVGKDVLKPKILFKK